MAVSVTLMYSIKNGSYSWLKILTTSKVIFHNSLQSSQRNASVQSLLLAGNFLYNQWKPSAGEGEVATFREYFENDTIFNENPVDPMFKWIDV